MSSRVSFVAGEASGTRAGDESFRLKEAGIDVVRYGPDEWAPGHGEAIRFTLPSGHSMELVHGMPPPLPPLEPLPPPPMLAL